MARAAVLAAVAAALLAGVAAVDRSKFRDCSASSFCRRHRDRVSEPEFRVVADSLKLDAAHATLTATLASSAGGAPPPFALSVAFLETGAARVRIVEKDDKPPRWESPDILIESATRAAASVEIAAASSAAVAALVGAGGAASGVTYVVFRGRADAQAHVLAVRHAPLRVELFAAAADGAPAGGAVGVPAVSLGDRGLLHFEHRRVKGDASLIAADAAAAGAAAGAAGADASGRKVLGWDEHGHALYEDGEAAPDSPDAAKGTADAAGRELLAAASADAEAGMWEEQFSSHHDSKPQGPTSVGMDVTFPAATHVYGIPEHASTHALRATDGSEGGAEYTKPYRLYNLDVFEYELDNPMALYGSIPFMLAHGPSGATAGVFWNNPTETFIDVKKGVRASGTAGVATRWVSEAGVFDATLFPGPSGKAVIRQYTAMTGTQALPPLFALAYHQCRWNYKDEADVFAVDAKFEEHAFPYDVLWLDIEHTDGKRYFTWDSVLFPRPAEMQNRLAERGRRMVTIIDPHIKRDAGFRIHSEAQEKGLYIRNAAGAEYDGWCWPGSSSYLDFTAPKVRDWWAGQFALDKYAGSTASLFTWNDMNEPSVFNGPEVSMHKDAKSLGGVEHREWHNLYGFYNQMATADGLARRGGGNARPFVLSRSFFAGSQRFGAIWTGDNAAKWEHLKMAPPMLLTIGAAGLAFAGADVGGFFLNPAPELFIRWYQAGAFQPFFRAHAHIDTARREPWLLGDETLVALREIVRARYTYLPLWYTLFWEASQSGLPPMRPLWLEYPRDAGVFATEDAWLVGDALLVKPVTEPGATTVDVVFPGDGPWYDAASGARVRAAGGPRAATLAAPLHGPAPVWQRGGAIVPRQMRARRASGLMAADPYTLVVALDAGGRAAGALYLDDGATFDYARKGLFRVREFAWAPAAAGAAAGAALRATSAGGGKGWAPGNTVERVVVLGVPRAPSAVVAVDGDAAAAAAAPAARPVQWDFDAAAGILTLRKPDVKVAYDWVIHVTY